jgi:ketosteroid isomerase-like protein
VPDSTMSISELIDKQQITEICYRYGVALDTRDWALLRSCFTADVVGHYGAPDPYRGYEAIEGLCRTTIESLSATQHLIGNVLVELDGDAASCSCYLHAQHVGRGDAEGEQFIFAGRYLDRFVRTAEGWRIAERRLTPMWSAGNAALLGAALPPES